jgi:hypothetical protein
MLDPLTTRMVNAKYQLITLCMSDMTSTYESMFHEEAFLS